MRLARPKKNSLLICLVLILGTAALYAPLTLYPFILYDDEQYVTANPHVVSGISWANGIWAFTSGEAANWHPLTWLSHQLDCTLFGLNPAGHHAVSLLFHIANTLLIFFFLRWVTGAVGRSALVAALFAWHPLHVESVAWISERKDVLSTFFWMGTLIAYAGYARARSRQEPPETASNSPARRRQAGAFYALTLLLFALGLMSKPMVVTLPFVLLLLDFWPLNRIRVRAAEAGRLDSSPPVERLRFLILEKIPFFALAAAGSGVTYLVQAHAGALWQVPYMDRLSNAAIAYGRYVAKLFWPGDLAIVYSHPSHWPAAWALGATLMLAAWTVLCVRPWRQKPFLAVGWLWFLGTLVPTIGLVQVGAQSMADRYTYIPSIGFFIAVAWGAADLLARRPGARPLIVGLVVAALAGCALVTSIQISYWQDNVRLFRRAMTVSPDNYIAANCLGKAYEKNGDIGRALFFYRAAVESAPRFPQSQFNYALALLAFGQREEALKHLQAAAELEPNNSDIQYNLGIYFAQQSSWTNAAQCFRNAARIRPGFAGAEKQLEQILAAHPEAR